MKPLTIEELKALEVCDWVWVILDEKDNTLPKNGAYCYVLCKDNNMLVCNSLEDKLFLHYSDYVTKWIAHKNKEQAEQNEQCVICHKDISNELPKIDVYGNRYCKDCYSDKCEKELALNKGEWLLPCDIGDSVYIPWVRDGVDGIMTLTCDVITLVSPKTDSYIQCYDFETDDLDFSAEFDDGKFYFSTFGKVWFTDKSESERRLAELKGE